MVTELVISTLFGLPRLLIERLFTFSVRPLVQKGGSSRGCYL